MQRCSMGLHGGREQRGDAFLVSVVGGVKWGWWKSGSVGGSVGEGKEGFLNEMPLKVNSAELSQVRGGRGNERGIGIRQSMKS